MPAKAGIHYEGAFGKISKHCAMDTGLRRYDG